MNSFSASPSRKHSVKLLRPRLVVAWALLGVFCTLCGCGSDPKVASKHTFANVLQALFDKNCAMLTPRQPDLFGPQAVTFPYRVYTAGFARDPDAPRFDALFQAGFLKPFPNGLWDSDTRDYDLTDKGRGLWKKSVGFCAGHMLVKSVNDFTEPVMQDGVEVSQVSVTLTTIYDDWAGMPAVRKAFAKVFKRDEHMPAVIAMQLMNDGWHVQGEDQLK